MKIKCQQPLKPSFWILFVDLLVVFSPGVVFLAFTAFRGCVIFFTFLAAKTITADSSLSFSNFPWKENQKRRLVINMNRWTRSLTKRASNALNPGETILVEQDGVRIDDGDNKVVNWDWARGARHKSVFKKLHCSRQVILTEMYQWPHIEYYGQVKSNLRWSWISAWSFY